VTDAENKVCEFQIANNTGESSSIYDLKDHKDIWPDIHYQEASRALTSLFERESLDLSKYQVLILNTQGSELQV
jgi:hypothetical protein